MPSARPRNLHSPTVVDEDGPRRQRQRPTTLARRPSNDAQGNAVRTTAVLGQDVQDLKRQSLPRPSRSATADIKELPRVGTPTTAQVQITSTSGSKLRQRGPIEVTEPMIKPGFFSQPRELRDMIYDHFREPTFHSDASGSGHHWEVSHSKNDLRLVSRQMKAEVDDRFPSHCRLHISDHHEMEVRNNIEGPPLCALYTTAFTADLLIVYTQRRYCIPHCVYLEVNAHQQWLTISIAKLTKLQETTLRVFILSSKNVKKAFELLARRIHGLTRLRTVKRVEVFAYEGERCEPRECDPKYPLAIWSFEDRNSYDLRMLDLSILDTLVRKAEKADDERRADESHYELEYLDCDVPFGDW